MDFSEIIGFLITILAIFFMFIKKKTDDKERVARSQDDDEESNTLEDFLKSLESDLDASKDFKKAESAARKIENKTQKQVVKSPPPAPKSIQKRPIQKKVQPQDFGFKTGMDSFTIQNSIEDKQYYVEKENVGEHLLSASFKKESRTIIAKKTTTTRAAGLLKRIPSKKDLIIIHEIFSPPKGSL